MGFCFLGVLTQTLRQQHHSSTVIPHPCLSSSIPLFPPFRYLRCPNDANMTMALKTKVLSALSSLSHILPPSLHLGMNEMLIVAAIYHSYYLL